MSEHYTAGFLFHEGWVLLVRKDRPEWQRDLWNGIGGKLEPGETGSDCMAREFKEETGIDVSAWMFLAEESGPGYRCQFFHHHVVGPRPCATQYNDRNELLGWMGVDFALKSAPLVGNLRWLLPLAMDWRRPRARVVSNMDIRERPSW